MPVKCECVKNYSIETGYITRLRMSCVCVQILRFRTLGQRLWQDYFHNKNWFTSCFSFLNVLNPSHHDQFTYSYSTLRYVSNKDSHRKYSYILTQSPPWTFNEHFTNWCFEMILERTPKSFRTALVNFPWQ